MKPANTTLSRKCSKKGIDLVPGWEVAYFIPPLQGIGMKEIYRQPARETLAYVITCQTSPSHVMHLKKKPTVLKAVCFPVFSCAEHHQPGGWDLPALAGHSCRRQRDANTDHTTHRLLIISFFIYHLRCFKGGTTTPPVGLAKLLLMSLYQGIGFGFGLTLFCFY